MALTLFLSLVDIELTINIMHYSISLYKLLLIGEILKKIHENERLKLFRK